MYVCDFCSGPASWSYPANDFVFRTDVSDHASKGGWAACDVCHELIEGGNRGELTTRALATMAELTAEDLAPEEVAFMQQMLWALHEAFWRERRGAAQPI